MTELEQLLLNQFEQQQSESEQRLTLLSGQLTELQKHVETTLKRYGAERRVMISEVKTIRAETQGAMKSMAIQIHQMQLALKQSDSSTAQTLERVSVSVASLNDCVMDWSRRLGN